MANSFSVGYLSAYTGAEVDSAVEKTSSLETEIGAIRDTLEVVTGEEIPGIKDSLDTLTDKVDNFGIDDLKEVSVTNPTQGQNLTYDATEGIWKNTSSSAQVGWGGIIGNIEDQTDLYDLIQEKTVTTIRNWS